METTEIITKLAQLCQKKFGANLITEVLSTIGMSHDPVVSVRITLPNKRVYEASGKNQKLAKIEACKKALAEF